MRASMMCPLSDPQLVVLWFWTGNVVSVLHGMWCDGGLGQRNGRGRGDKAAMEETCLKTVVSMF